MSKSIKIVYVVCQIKYLAMWAYSSEVYAAILNKKLEHPVPTQMRWNALNRESSKLWVNYVNYENYVMTP